MVVSNCQHDECKKHGLDRHGNQRWKCKVCKKTWTDTKPNRLDGMYVNEEKAKLALRLLVEGNSIRATERITELAV